MVRFKNKDSMLYAYFKKSEQESPFEIKTVIADFFFFTEKLEANIREISWKGEFKKDMGWIMR